MRALSNRYFSIIVAISIQVPDVLAQSGPFKPDRAIEFIVGTSPGGSIDRVARTSQKILQDKAILGSSTVVNKGGAGGVLAYNYLNQNPGGHHIGIASLTLLTTNIMGTNSIRYSDLTPIALLVSEYVTFSVRADSPIKSGRDLLERLRKDPTSVSIAGASARGSSNHIATGMVMKAGKVDVGKAKFVVFSSSGDSMTAVLGGHVDVLTTSASTAVPQIEAGKLRMIAIAGPKRVGGSLANVPTWREQGVDAVFSNWFGAFGPKGMSNAQIAFWDETFGKLVKTAEWQADLDKNLWVNDYLNSRAIRKFLDDQFSETKILLTDLGVIK